MKAFAGLSSDDDDSDEDMAPALPIPGRASPLVNEDVDDDEEMEDNTIQNPFENDDEVFMFEDSLKNLVSAKENFNITGVLIKGKTLAEENGAEIAKRFIQIDKPVLSELMEKAPSLFA